MEHKIRAIQEKEDSAMFNFFILLVIIELVNIDHNICEIIENSISNHQKILYHTENSQM